MGDRWLTSKKNCLEHIFEITDTVGMLRRKENCHSKAGDFSFRGVNDFFLSKINVQKIYFKIVFSAKLLLSLLL